MIIGTMHAIKKISWNGLVFFMIHDWCKVDCCISSIAGNELGYVSQEDWYQITGDAIRTHGGSVLLSKYENSPSKLVTSVFSDKSWKIWKFNKVPDGFWDDSTNQKHFMEWLGTNTKA